MSSLKEQAENYVKQNIATLESLKSQSLTNLNQKKNDKSWSAMECIEHLNRYHRFYNPLLLNSVNKNSEFHTELKGTWYGQSFINSVKAENVKKKNTLKHMNPKKNQNRSNYTTEGLEELLNHQQNLLNLIHNMRHVDINKKSIPVEFFKLLKMRVGEALLFVIEHDRRHLAQAQRAVTSS